MKQNSQFHLSGVVNDLQSSQAFYTQVLGCKVLRDGRNWIDLEFFGHQLTLHRSCKADSEASSGHFGVNLSSLDWQELRDRVSGMDLVVREHGGRKFILQDPNRIDLEFKQAERDTPDFKVRHRLDLGDIGEIARMHGVVYGAEHGHGVAFEAYVAQGLVEYFQRFDASVDRLWIYKDGGRIAGTLFLMQHEGSALMRFFLVHPDYRHLGLGKVLIGRFMVALDELGYKHSFLWTTNELAAAASLYQRHGFVLIEEKASARFGKAVIEQRYDWFRDRK